MKKEYEKRLATADRLSSSELGKFPERSGIYAAWKNGDRKCLYVGKSGNIFSRIKSHYSGQRGSDQFCLYVYDRYIHSNRPSRITTPEINELTGKWIKDNICFGYVQARKSLLDELEVFFRRKWRPTLNPLK